MESMSGPGAEGIFGTEAEVPVSEDVRELAAVLGTAEWSSVLPGVVRIAPETLPFVLEALHGQHPD
jgi:hypothetical protein